MHTQFAETRVYANVLFSGREDFYDIVCILVHIILLKVYFEVLLLRVFAIVVVVLPIR